jgi:hypothetical protein
MQTGIPTVKGTAPHHPYWPVGGSMQTGIPTVKGTAPHHPYWIWVKGTVVILSPWPHGQQVFPLIVVILRVGRCCPLGALGISSERCVEVRVGGVRAIGDVNLC